MPWSVSKGHGCPESKPYAVVKEGGDRVACHDSEASAQEQVKALYANEKKGKEYAELLERLGACRPC